MINKWIFFGPLFIVFIGITVLISILFTGPSLWLYIVIYALLFLLWYKPVLVFYHSLRAGHMLKKREYAAVSEEYDKIARIKRNEGYGDYAQAMAHFYRKQWVQARNACQRALEKGIKTQKKSMEPLTELMLITVYMELGQFQKAKKIIDQLETKKTGKNKVPAKLTQVLTTLKGEWFFHQGFEDEAVQSFAEVWELDRELIGEEIIYYAELLMKRNETDKAKEILLDYTSPDHKWKLFRIREEKVEKLLGKLS